MMTRTEEIRIPYRHGIMHGMDLGYNNEHVAAKSWAALFAVRDWAVKATRNELNPPELEPVIEKTLWESIEGYMRIREETERLRQWGPRQVTIGESIPVTGQVQDYPPDTPEQVTVAFLTYWLKNNFGYMAECYAPMLHMRPVDVKERFRERRLLEFELIAVNDVTPAVADVKVRVKLETKGDVSSLIYELDSLEATRKGDLVYIPDESTIWGISTWRVVQ